MNQTKPLKVIIRWLWGLTLGVIFSIDFSEIIIVREGATIQMFHLHHSITKFIINSASNSCQQTRRILNMDNRQQIMLVANYSFKIYTKLLRALGIEAKYKYILNKILKLNEFIRTVRLQMHLLRISWESYLKIML